MLEEPSHDPEQKSYPWRWTQREQEAFERPKKAVTEKPTLAYVDQALPFREETDASNSAYGAVLSQECPDGKGHPAAYMSTPVTAPERSYSIGRQGGFGDYQAPSALARSHKGTHQSYYQPQEPHELPKVTSSQPETSQMVASLAALQLHNSIPARNQEFNTRRPLSERGA